MITLNSYELLLDRIIGEIPVVELPLSTFGTEGNYFDGMIFIDSALPQHRKREILSEEYAHFKTSVGNIINYEDVESRKQELKARRYAIEMVITLDDLINCRDYGCTTIYECADFLSVSHELLHDTLSHYQKKYGINHQYKDKLFIFMDDSLLILDKKIS